MEVGQVSVAGSRTRVTDFILLTKPNITFMVLITTVVGFYLGSRENLNFLLLINTVIGTALIAGGASALNQYVERHLDARMVRTRTRPLPDGRLLPSEALAFSTIISVIGTLYLSFFVNVLTGLLGLLTLAAYIFVYTPLKTRTTLCTLIGAIPGATPPMMGWTASTGNIDAAALSLFANSLSLADAALFLDRLDIHGRLCTGRLRRCIAAGRARGGRSYSSVAR